MHLTNLLKLFFFILSYMQMRVQYLFSHCKRTILINQFAFLNCQLQLSNYFVHLDKRKMSIILFFLEIDLMRIVCSFLYLYCTSFLSLRLALKQIFLGNLLVRILYLCNSSVHTSRRTKKKNNLINDSHHSFFYCILSFSKRA